jgi:hypothetical protein
MRKLFIISVCCICGVILFSCNNKSGAKADTKDNKEQPALTSDKGGSPAGTYTTKEGDKLMQFVLNADGSGYEMNGTDKRPFTWKTKDGKVFFVYDGETPEWELPLYADKGEIHYGSLVYKKQ